MESLGVERLKRYAWTVLDRLSKRMRMRGRNKIVQARKKKIPKFLTMGITWELAAQMLEKEMDNLEN